MLFKYLMRYRKNLGFYSTGGTVRGDENPTLFDDLTTGRLLKESPNPYQSFFIKVI